jgi:hypothetical protein
MGTEFSVIRKIIFNKFKEKGIAEPSLAAEVDSVIWCKSLVENGKGISFALEKDIQKEVLEGRMKILPLKDYAYVNAVAATRAEMLNPIIEQFIEMVKETFHYTGSARTTDVKKL